MSTGVGEVPFSRLCSYWSRVPSALDDRIGALHMGRVRSKFFRLAKNSKRKFWSKR